MKDRDELGSEINSNIDTKEKKTNGNKKSHKKSSNKILWVVFAALVIGLISFVAANNDTFHLSMSSNTNTYSCRTTGKPLPYGLQSGVSLYDRSCFTQTKEQQDEKRWQDILQASPVIIAASSAVTALSLIVLTWQVSRLVKTMSKKQ